LHHNFVYIHSTLTYLYPLSLHDALPIYRPLVAIYGSTSPQFTPPLSQHVEICRLGLDCSPCFERECPLGHLNCLNQLMPDQVFRSEEHTSELQSRENIVCRLLLEKKKKQ